MTMLKRGAWRLSVLALVAVVVGCSLMPESKKIDYGTRSVYQWKTNQWVK